MSYLVSWIATQQGIQCILHYLEDFFLIGPPHSARCQQNLHKFIQFCSTLGIPVALEKVEGPFTSLSLLGITLDTHRMEAWLPQDKLTRIEEMLSQLLSKKQTSKYKILSLAGLLQHATKVVKCGQPECMQQQQSLESSTTTPDSTAQTSHGGTLSSSTGHSKGSQYQFYTSHHHSNWQVGPMRLWCRLQSLWLQFRWTLEWVHEDIMAKEFVLVVLMTAVWGPLLARQQVLLQCNNLSLITSINKCTAKPSLVMDLLHCLWFFTVYYDITIDTSHILGAVNTAANQFSRNYLPQFYTSYPSASRLPTPLPRPLLQIVSPTGPDWTSSKFRYLFKAIIQSTWSLPTYTFQQNMYNTLYTILDHLPV